MSSNLTGTEGPQSPDIPEVEIPPTDFVQSGKAIGEGVGQSGFWTGFGQMIVSVTRKLLSEGLKWALEFVFKVLNFFLGVLISGTNGAEEPLAELSVTMINHLLGVKVSADAVKMRRAGEPTHPDIDKLGSLVMARFMAAFDDGGVLQPGDAAAKQFVNRAVAMSVDGWALDAIIDWIPHDWLDFDKLASLDDKLRQSIGLGRMMRAVLHPALHTLVVTPYDWKLNKQYRPKLLGAGEVIHGFLTGKWTEADMREELARQGFSDARIDTMVQMHSKYLGLADVSFMEIYGGWPREQARSYLLSQGWDTASADLMLDVQHKTKILAIQHESVAAAAAAFVNKDIEVDQFAKIVEENIPNDELRQATITAASTRRELRVAHLSEGQAEAAVIQGFWTIDQYTNYLKRAAFSDDDILTLQLLVQEKIDKVSQAEAKKESAAKAAAAAKAAKLQAQQQRQAELEAARTHKDLSLASVERGYVEGQLTLDQYRQFLVNDKQAPDDIQTLLGLAQAKRADFTAAQAKRAKADQKLGATTLTASQLEKAVEVGAMTIDEYATVLGQQGIADGDIQILTKELQAKVDAAAAAKARHDAIEARLAQKGLSLPQFELAVRHGLRTMADFKSFLATNGYGPEDQATLSGLLQDQVDADTAAAKRKATIEANLAQKHISLVQLEDAVRRGIRPMSDYQAALTQNGIVPSDVQTMVDLLESKIDADAEAAKHKVAVEAKAAQKGISLPNLERAARLGIITPDKYRAALQAAALTPEDIDVMMSLLDADIEKVADAQAKEAAAAAKLQNKPVTLADLQHGVELGLRTMADYQLALKNAGFDADAIGLMSSLLQDKIDQQKAALARKAQLDALHSEREVSRATFEKAVVDGIETMDDYKAFLVEQGYGDEDQAILVDLLQQKIG